MSKSSLLEKEKRTAELPVAGKQLVFQNEAKEKSLTALDKASNLYSFISQVKQNIFYVKDEQALFHNACQIAIEFGKFKIAWIGLFDNKNKTITLVDQIGIPEEDIIKFKDIPLRAGGPQEHIIRTGKYFICNDIPNNAEMESWKPLAAKQGICSLMLLPIKKSGRIIGTFNLYAAGYNFFGTEEIELLEELVVDISFALDIFEKEETLKRTQKLMVQNERRFRVLIEKSADMITLSTFDGALIYGSNSIMKGLGYSEEELLQMSVFDIIHPDDISKAMENRDKIVQMPGESFYYQQRRRHKNGAWIWCEGTLTNMLHEPGINALVSNFRDISEKKKAEQERDFDRNNLEALINNTHDLMWSVDKDFNLINSNQPFDNIIKLTSGKVAAKGSNVLDITYTKDQAQPYKELYQRAFTGESFTEVIYNEQPVDSWSEISYCPIRKGDEVIGIACHSRDITKIKKAELQVVINEKRFRALVENGADAVAILSPKGNLDYISPSIQRILGYTEEEAMKLDMSSLTYPGDLAALETVWEQMLACYGVPVPGFTCRVLRKNGDWCWLEGTLTNLLQDPSVNGIVSNFRDITEKKLAEEGLLLTQFAIDNAGDAVFWMTPDARIAKVNEAACIMLGYKRQDLVALSIPDIDPGYDAEKWHVHYEELRQKGSLFFETIQQAKDGRLIPVEVRANYIKFGNAEFNCAFVRDISERKIAERNLIKSETKLKEAQAIAHIGNFEIDLVNFSEVWSDQMYNILGVEKKVAPSDKLFSSFIHPDDIKLCREAFLSYQNGAMDYRLIRKDGVLRYANSEWRFEFDKNNKPVRLYGILQDITDRKLAEMERIKMVNDLVLRNTELEQFGYIISHNLRSPVANIIGASSVLNDPDLSTEDKEVLSKGMSESVKKLDDVVQDLNNILQVKGEISNNKEIVHFSELVDDIKFSIKNLVDKNGITIKHDFSEINGMLTIKSYMYSIFYNLISNSIKYRRQHIPSFIIIESRLEKNKMELIFTDNGMGIDLNKNGGDVFGLYKRFHNNIEGKGMGLFMVKTQVETLGGKISIKSAENKGTEFKIEFEV